MRVYDLGFRLWDKEDDARVIADDDAQVLADLDITPSQKHSHGAFLHSN